MIDLIRKILVYAVIAGPIVFVWELARANGARDETEFIPAADVTTYQAACAVAGEDRMWRAEGGRGAGLLAFRDEAVGRGQRRAE